MMQSDLGGSLEDDFDRHGRSDRDANVTYLFGVGVVIVVLDGLYGLWVVVLHDLHLEGSVLKHFGSFRRFSLYERSGPRIVLWNHPTGNFLDFETQKNSGPKRFRETIEGV